MYCYLSPKIALGILFKRPTELQKILTSHSGYIPSRTKIFLLLLPGKGIQTVSQMKALRQYYVTKE